MSVTYNMINGISTTEVYQKALPIMGHDYAHKYANYYAKKQKTIQSGKANYKDSGKQKTYNAEVAALAEYRKLYPNNKKTAILNWKGTLSN